MVISKTKHLRHVIYAIVTVQNVRELILNVHSVLVDCICWIIFVMMCAQIGIFRMGPIVLHAYGGV